MYGFKNVASKNVRQRLKKLKGETDKYRIMFEEFNTVLSVTDRTSKQNTWGNRRPDQHYQCVWPN